MKSFYRDILEQLQKEILVFISSLIFAIFLFSRVYLEHGPRMTRSYLEHDPILKLPLNCSLEQPVVDFALFETFKKRQATRVEFSDVKVTNSHVKIEGVVKPAVIVTDNRLKFEEAKRFCKYHNAELPTGFLYYKKMRPLQATHPDEFWVDGQVNIITKEANVSAEINEENLSKIFERFEEEWGHMELVKHEPCQFPMRTTSYDLFTKSYICENDTFTSNGLVKVWTSKNIHCEPKKLTQKFIAENNLFDTRFLETHWIQSSEMGFARWLSGWTLAEITNGSYGTEIPLPICYPESWVKPLVLVDSKLKISMHTRSRVLCIKNK